MRRSAGSAASLVGAGVVVAVGTLAWHGIKNTQVLLQTQHEIRKVRRYRCLLSSAEFLVAVATPGTGAPSKSVKEMLERIVIR